MLLILVYDYKYRSYENRLVGSNTQTRGDVPYSPV